MTRHIAVFALLAFLSSCNENEPTTVKDKLPTETVAPSAPPPTSESTQKIISATMRVVDLAGSPLPNMAPVATRKPNAFDPPISTGSATDQFGNGTISFPVTEDLFLRAWDPTLNYFPNNFYEILAGGDRISDDLVIQMVRASRLSVQLILPGDQIAANTSVGLMLFHPTRGAWWPSEGKTDANGFVVFSRLPAGQYVLRFKVESGARLEYRETALPPGGLVDLGIVTLQ